MPQPPADPAVVAEARRLRGEGLSVRETAKKLRMSTGWVSNVTADGYKPPAPKAAAPERTETGGFVEKDDGTATATALTSEVVRTIEDAVRVAGVDLAVWYVDRWECTQWTVGMKVRQAGGIDGTRQEQQYRVKLYLRRIAPRAVLAAVDALYARIAKHAPKYPPAPKVKNGSGEPFLGLVGLFDAHFGKLCWGAETGANYDLNIAERVYANALDDMLGETAARPVSQWVLPIGNDFYHIDNSRNTTFAGTPQDVDGRYARVIEAGEMAVVAAIERLMALAPVKVVWVPGNHDPTTSYHLARTVAAWFRRCDRVEVDYSPSPRKYVAWNGVLLGLTHGNEEKRESLPSLMATERPDEWAKAKLCREWLVGHDHRARQWVTKATDTYEGTVVRVLRAITGTDGWHHRKGYVGTPPAGEIYWYGRDRGYAGHAVVPARVA